MIVQTKNGLERRDHLVAIHRGLVTRIEPILADHEEAFYSITGEVVVVETVQPSYNQFDLPDMRMEYQLKEFGQ